MVLAGCGLVGAPEAVPPTPPASPSATASPSLSAFYEQEIRWTNCGPADCATLVVPLDYADPEGETFDLAITRVQATGERLGSLFVNPGGPGGSAVEYAKAADAIVGGPVREHFDVVGVDPRGVGFSDPIECLTDAQLDELGALDGTPDSRAEERALIELSRLPGQGCAARSPDLLPHVSTVDSARDLDIARNAVDDDVLNYLGLSYGTMLGATYAELFPERVGRMVLDGALPAELDTVAITRGQAIGFEGAVRDFAADCLTHDDCPLTGDVDTATGQLRDWFASLDTKPIPAGDRDLNEALASYAVLTNLYAPSYDFPRLRSALIAAMERREGTELMALLDSRISRDERGRYTDNSTEAFYAVSCLDRPFLGTVDEVRALEREWKEVAPTFGPSLAWSLLVCQDWPATTDPITVTRAVGSNPILVVSTTGDPATPYVWGQQLAESLDNGHLLTYDGIGHTAYKGNSGCIDGAVDDFLVSGTLPPEGTVCLPGS